MILKNARVLLDLIPVYETGLVDFILPGDRNNMHIAIS